VTRSLTRRAGRGEGKKFGPRNGTFPDSFKSLVVPKKNPFWNCVLHINYLTDYCSFWVHDSWVDFYNTNSIFRKYTLFQINLLLFFIFSEFYYIQLFGIIKTKLQKTKHVTNFLYWHDKYSQVGTPAFTWFSDSPNSEIQISTILFITRLLGIHRTYKPI